MADRSLQRSSEEICYNAAVRKKPFNWDVNCCFTWPRGLQTPESCSESCSLAASRASGTLLASLPPA